MRASRTLNSKVRLRRCSTRFAYIENACGGWTAPSPPPARAPFPGRRDLRSSQSTRKGGSDQLADEGARDSLLAVPEAQRTGGRQLLRRNPLLYRRSAAHMRSTRTASSHSGGARLRRVPRCAIQATMPHPQRTSTYFADRRRTSSGGLKGASMMVSSSELAVSVIPTIAPTQPIASNFLYRCAPRVGGISLASMATSGYGDQCRSTTCESGTRERDKAHRGRFTYCALRVLLSLACLLVLVLV